MGAGGEITFNQYVQNLGLISTPALTAIEKEMIKQKALQGAKNIIDLDKKRKKHNG